MPWVAYGSKRKPQPKSPGSQENETEATTNQEQPTRLSPNKATASSTANHIMALAVLPCLLLKTFPLAPVAGAFSMWCCPAWINACSDKLSRMLMCPVYLKTRLRHIHGLTLCVCVCVSSRAWSRGPCPGISPVSHTFIRSVNKYWAPTAFAGHRPCAGNRIQKTQNFSFYRADFPMKKIML